MTSEPSSSSSSTACRASTSPARWRSSPAPAQAHTGHVPHPHRLPGRRARAHLQRPHARPGPAPSPPRPPRTPCSSPAATAPGAPTPRLVDWLREHGPRAERLVSVCTGAILLAEAGLLDGRRVTTHWAYCDQLARRPPGRSRSTRTRSSSATGSVATSAGVTAGIDLALALVEEDLGRDAALTIARHLVVFLRRPGNQAQFSAQLAAQTAQREPLREVQQWITEHPGDDLSVEPLAARARLSPRHFARAFQAETGMTPGRYVDRVRLEHARRLLEDTADGVEEISRTCGYGTSEAMRRAFVKTLGHVPGRVPPPLPPGRRAHSLKPAAAPTHRKGTHADRHRPLRPLHRPRRRRPVRDPRPSPDAELSSSPRRPAPSAPTRAPSRSPPTRPWPRCRTPTS